MYRTYKVPLEATGAGVATGRAASRRAAPKCTPCPITTYLAPVPLPVFTMAASKRQKIDWITGWVQRAQLSHLTLTHADKHVITLSDGTRVLSGVGLGVTSTSRVPVDSTEEYGAAGGPCQC